MQKIRGTLVPLSALWSESYPEACFGAGEVFLDWLSETHQNGWQMLPIHQPQLEEHSSHLHVPSPYKSYGIGIDPRYRTPDFDVSAVDIATFTTQNKDWIHDYALFCALRDFYRTDNWTQWPEKLRRRDEEALSTWREEHTSAVEAHIREQAILHAEYHHMRAKARSLGITLVGDVPFYLGLCSPLVWQFQSVFDLEPDGSMRRVSGLPDGPKAHFGRQVWGHPLYDWSEKESHEELLRLWKLRLRYVDQLFDWARLDHAKGFFFYGSLNLEDESDDQVMEGGGASFLSDVLAYTDTLDLRIIAEDSGDRITELRELLTAREVPGLRTVRFSFGRHNPDEIHLPYADVSAYPPNMFASTTTHDTETLTSFLQGLNVVQRELLSKAMGVSLTGEALTDSQNVVAAVCASPARYVLIPIQDWFGWEERINTPGTELAHNDPNWRFRLPKSIEKLDTRKIHSIMSGEYDLSIRRHCI